MFQPGLEIDTFKSRPRRQELPGAHLSASLTFVTLNNHYLVINNCFFFPLSHLFHLPLSTPPFFTITPPLVGGGGGRNVEQNRLLRIETCYDVTYVEAGFYVYVDVSTVYVACIWIHLITYQFVRTEKCVYTKIKTCGPIRNR